MLPQYTTGTHLFPLVSPMENHKDSYVALILLLILNHPPPLLHPEGFLLHS